MVEAKDAQYQLDQALSDFANEISPLKFGIETFLVKALQGIVETATNAVKAVKELIEKLRELNQQQQNNNINSSMRNSDLGVMSMSTPRMASSSRTKSSGHDFCKGRAGVCISFG